MLAQACLVTKRPYASDLGYNESRRSRRASTAAYDILKGPYEQMTGR